MTRWMMLVYWPLGVARLLFISIALALAQVWANKLRSVLTTTGIVIGVASVTAVIAALTGLKAHVLAEFEALGTNKMFVYPQLPGRGRYRFADWNVVRFWPEQFEGLKEHCPSISHYTMMGRGQYDIKSPYKTVTEVRVTGIEPDWHAVENRTVTLGRPFTLVDNEGRKPVCLITPELRDELRLDRDCIGDTILLGNRTFQIVGLVEPRVESMMFGMQGRTHELFIPFQTAWKMYRPWFDVVATSRSPELSEDARAELRFFLRRTRHLKPGEPDTFGIEVIEEHLQRFRTVATTMTVVAGGIVGISLLVGGVGIMNIMLVSVSERTREIGLRKAVGARPAAILLQFLVESVMLCFVGGAIGVGIGQLLTTAVASIPGAHLKLAYIPLWAIAMAFGFAALVGIVFGMFPAIKAARLDPIEALRHE